MNYLSNFSEKLKILLTENDLSVVKLAKIIGVADTTVYDYLDKLYLPSVHNLVKIADYFNLTTDYLLGLDEENLSDVFYEYKPFPQQIEVIKKRYGKSEYYIIRNAEIHASSFYRWKRGTYDPSVENLTKIAKLFGCSLDFVLGRAKV